MLFPVDHPGEIISAYKVDLSSSFFPKTSFKDVCRKVKLEATTPFNNI